jgi:hypothetical protein
MTHQTEDGRRRLRRQNLAYGQWLIADGATVLFNRAYSPIWQKSAAGDWQPIEGNPRIQNIETTQCFYSDGHPEREKAKLARDAMKALGVGL